MHLTLTLLGLGSCMERAALYGQPNLTNSTHSILILITFRRQRSWEPGEESTSDKVEFLDLEANETETGFDLNRNSFHSLFVGSSKFQ